MYVHDIPYIATFIVSQNIVVDLNYSMLLGRPWFKDIKVAHDQGITWPQHKEMVCQNYNNDQTFGYQPEMTKRFTMI